MNAPPRQYVVQHVARRTRINLEFIEMNEKRFGAEVFEVTQLVNSMLGLLIFPVEKILDQLNDENFYDINSLDIDYDLQINKRGLDQSDYKRMLVMIRHSFAHGNLDLGEDGRKITYISLWNYPPRQSRIPENENWRISIHVRELKRLVLTLCQILENGLENLDPHGQGIRALAEKPDLLDETEAA